MSRLVRAARVVVLVVLAAAIGVVASVALTYSHTPKAFALTRVNRSLAPILPGRPIWILALGDDGRIENGVAVGCGCADAIHLIGVPAGGGSAIIINLPRDTKYGTRRVNELLKKGTAAAAASFSAFFGIKIQYVLRTNFVGFAGLVDAMGGVTVNVPVAVNNDANTNINLPAGPHLFATGDEALRFARSRHGIPSGDLGRSLNQAALMVGLFRQLATEASGASIGTLFAKYAPYVSITGASLGEIQSLATLAQSVNPDTVRIVNTPTKPYNVYRTVTTRIGRRLVRRRVLVAAMLQLKQPAAARLFTDARTDAILQGAYNPLGL
jgi:LCP family protein required for cell wall assembly